VGALGLLVIIMGLVLTISGSGASEVPYAGQEEWYDENDDDD